MDPSYRIRQARHEDLPLLTQIEREAAIRFKPFGLAELLAAIVTPQEILVEACAEGHVWVAVGADDTPVGFAVASVIDGVAHLDELDVHPSHGRRGLGTALVETVCQWASDAGFAAMTLSTLRDIPWNAPFYERLGFRILRSDELTPGLQCLIEVEAEYGLPPQGRVIMRRELATR
jgi:ribosomal protein S18 acetylase RimI-like enzyme